MTDYNKLHNSDPDGYFLKMCEELSELQVAILHYRAGKIEYAELIDEIADVRIQVSKLVHWLGKYKSEAITLVRDNINACEVKKILQLRKLIDEIKEL